MSSFQNSPFGSAGDMPITEAQRERSIDYLQQAYAEGRLAGEDFDTRLEKVLRASNRRELSAAFAGFVQVPLSSQAIGAHPVYRPLVNMDADSGLGRMLGATAYWTAPFTWLIGPAIAYSIAKPGSFARAAAGRSFNLTLQITLLCALLGLITVLTGIGHLTAVAWIAFSVFSVMGGINAANGRLQRNPLGRVLPVRPLEENTTQPRSLGR